MRPCIISTSRLQIASPRPVPPFCRAVVDISTEDAAGTVRVAVHDRGVGIPEAFRSRVFGRFAQADSTATRQKGGTGLGLAICKRLIELMQGRIGFDERPGGGTTFWFELPRQAG